MSKFATFLGANSAVLAGAAVVVAGAVGVGAYVITRSATGPLPEVAAVEQPASEPAALPAPEPETAPALAQDTPAESEAISLPLETPLPPSIDEVRVQSGGVFVVAGQASPDSTIAIMLDGEQNTEVQTNAGGAFAAVSIIAPNPDPQVLTVVQRDAEGELESIDEVILAPIRSAEPAQTTQAQEQPAQSAPATAPTEPSTEVAALESTSDPAPAVEVAQETPEPEPEPVERVAVLRSNASGVELVNPSQAPEVMKNVAIDTISYTEIGEVKLAGRAQSQAASVRVYLDNKALVELTVDEAGRWRGDLPQVDTGVYTLRVDEVDTTGAISSRVETPFKREAPEVLAAATQQDTATIATAVTVQPGASLWAIARERYGEGTLYVRVFEANRATIKNPDLIYPGQVFALPD